MLKSQKASAGGEGAQAGGAAAGAQPSIPTRLAWVMSAGSLQLSAPPSPLPQLQGHLSATRCVATGDPAVTLAHPGPCLGKFQPRVRTTLQSLAKYATSWAENIGETLGCRV